MAQHRIGPRTIIAGLAAALMILTIGVGTANASAESSKARTFAAQAAAAGLTRAQAAQLQTSVDDYLAKIGGVQISANKIQFAEGATLLLPLPGEQQAHELTAAADATCDGGHMCAWQYTDFSGGKIDLFF